MVLLEPDVLLYELPLSGVPELRPEWSAAARGHLVNALERDLAGRGLGLRGAQGTGDMLQRQYLLLNEAMARSLLAHGPGSAMPLKQKERILDWTLGPGVRVLDDQGRYGLFIYIRDSYSTGVRQAAMMVGALVGVSVPLGVQQAYAHLIDLDSGQLIWASRMTSSTGDLREAEQAARAVGAMLQDFPL